MRYSWTIPAALIVAGCGQKTEPPAPAPAPALAIPAAPAPDRRGAVEGAAKAFLRGAKPDDLSVRFKQVVAPPDEEDKAKGYSDRRLDTWLRSLTMPPAAGATCPIATEQWGIAIAPAGPGHALMLVVLIDGAWRIDWFHFAPGDPVVPVTISANDSDLAMAQFTAAAFVEAIGHGRTPQAQSLLSSSAMSKIAPPLFPKDEAVGYSVNRLGEELPKLVPPGTAFKTFDLESQAGGFLVRANLKAGGTLMLVVSKGDRPGLWKVMDARLV